ncbi:MAG TPA: hypothetical protein VI385_03745, partial [Flavisolibacter sp.]
MDCSNGLTRRFQDPELGFHFLKVENHGGEILQLWNKILVPFSLFTCPKNRIRYEMKWQISFLGHSLSFGLHQATKMLYYFCFIWLHPMVCRVFLK